MIAQPLAARTVDDDQRVISDERIDVSRFMPNILSPCSQSGDGSPSSECITRISHRRNRCLTAVFAPIFFDQRRHLRRQGALAQCLAARVLCNGDVQERGEAAMMEEYWNSRLDRHRLHCRRDRQVADARARIPAAASSPSCSASPARSSPACSARRSAGTKRARARASSPRSSARSSCWSSTGWSRAAGGPEPPGVRRYCRSACSHAAAATRLAPLST